MVPQRLPDAASASLTVFVSPQAARSGCTVLCVVCDGIEVLIAGRHQVDSPSRCGFLVCITLPSAWGACGAVASATGFIRYRKCASAQATALAGLQPAPRTVTRW